jgi:hypothetical protein
MVVLVVSGLCLGLGRLGADAAAAARARTAADAAALAGAVDGEVAARSIAADNGGELTAYRREGSDVEVTARVGRSEAVARARAPGTSGAVPTGATVGLRPEMRQAIARAEALLGRPVPITSGWRSPAKQQALWENRHRNRYPVAPPGTSKHELGLAIDVPLSFVPHLLAVAADAGLCQPLPGTDPVHFEWCASGPGRP